MSIRVVKVHGLRTPEQRAGVCYVGRAFAGWPSSPWGNPFRPKPRGVSTGMDTTETMLADCLDRFRRHAHAQSVQWLADLWEACEHGVKPLGCWCVASTHGDGQPIVCHAQILAEMLHNVFIVGGLNDLAAGLHEKYVEGAA